jgi:hypothetical protein
MIIACFAITSRCSRSSDSSASWLVFSYTRQPKFVVDQHHGHDQRRDVWIGFAVSAKVLCVHSFFLAGA